MLLPKSRFRHLGHNLGPLNTHSPVPPVETPSGRPSITVASDTFGYTIEMGFVCPQPAAYLFKRTTIQSGDPYTWQSSPQHESMMIL